jgi:hypothetical protein
MALPRLARYPVMAGLIACDALPSDCREEVVRLQTEDRAESKGVLHTKGGEKTVICLMHPRADMSRHYLTPSTRRRLRSFRARIAMAWKRCGLHS